MTSQFTITVGLDCSKAPLPISVADARRFVLAKALEYFPQGHTVREATGRWRSDAPVRSAGSNVYSHTVTEPVIEVLWCTDDAQTEEGRDLVGRFARECRDGLYQEAVMVSIERPEVFFV